jgi:hypothetical protein
MARQFGVVTAKNGTVSGVLANSCKLTENVKDASVIDENGKTVEIKAYSVEKTADISGVVEDPAAVAAAGSTITLAGQKYLVSSKTLNEASEAFTTADISAKTADNATITELAAEA